MQYAVHAHTLTHIHTHRPRTQTHTHTYTCTYTHRPRAQTHTHILMHIHTQTAHANTHAHAHAHTHVCTQETRKTTRAGAHDLWGVWERRFKEHHRQEMAAAAQVSVCVRVCLCAYVYLHICRVGQMRTYKNTAYPDPLYNRIRMTVHGFWPTVYIRRIWTVFAGCAGFESQQQQSLLLFLSLFFSRAFSY